MHDWLAYLIAAGLALAGTGLLALIAKGTHCLREKQDDRQDGAQERPACWTLERGDILLVEEPGALHRNEVTGAGLLAHAMTRIMEGKIAPKGVVTVPAGFRIIGKIHLVMDAATPPEARERNGLTFRVAVVDELDEYPGEGM